MPESLTDKLTRHWVGLRMAHQAVMVNDANKLLKNDREAVVKHQQSMREVKAVPDEDAVHVGDVVHHVHQNQSTTAGKGLAAVAAATALGLAGMGGYLLNRPAVPAPTLPPAATAPAPPATPAPAPEPVELRVKWWIEGEEIKTEIEQERRSERRD